MRSRAVSLPLAWCFSTALGLPALRASFLRSARSARRSAMECSMTLRLTLPARPLKLGLGALRRALQSLWGPKKPALTRENTEGPRAGRLSEPARRHGGEEV